MFQARLLLRKIISTNILEFKFERPKHFNYKPGQFISILVGRAVKRSYSLSSFSGETGTISIIVDISPKGVGTKYLKGLKIGQKITFEGPYGCMVLPSNYSLYSNIFFICTGTGVSPFFSIIKHLNKNKYAGRITLLYSEKFSVDFCDLSSITVGNTYLTTTREKKDGYLFGRVTEHFDLFSLSRESLFFICGNTRMIVDVVKRLDEMGVDKKHIIFESFYY